MLYVIESPRPVPAPTSFVVKNGSNTRLAISAGIPGPASWKTIRIRSPSSDEAIRIFELQSDVRGLSRAWHVKAGASLLDTLVGFSFGSLVDPLTGASFAQPATTASEDPVDRLEKLADLRDRGVLTPEEFEAQKKRILGE